MRRREGLYITAEVLVPVLVILGVLIFTNTAGGFYFPPLQEVLVAFQKNWLFTRIPLDLVPSLVRLLSGFLIAVLIGVLLGVLLGRVAWLRRQTSPIIEFLRAIPPPALLPFTILAIGVDSSAKVALIAFVCVWPILLNTMDGVAGIEPTMAETAQVYHIPTIDALLHVQLRAASPQIFAGMRTALPLAIIMMVISEMVASTDGLGYFVLQAQRTFALADMWSGILLLGILGYLLNLVFTLIERGVLAWHRGARAAAQ
ncbi:ABC transporter permease [Microbacterium terrisoli]|jgi:ABC-type nitrate/sulfonate/bicarbonate transport system permease component|uniref:ABC transporter permease n=1 Tax=Microbacterium terrisoli TaxID=3242192 RepID=UPI0028046EB2|nr:ABC transporter permease subunit [Microbacterium protaetiae]